MIPRNPKNTSAEINKSLIWITISNWSIKFIWEVVKNINIVSRIPIPAGTPTKNNAILDEIV